MAEVKKVNINRFIINSIIAVCFGLIINTQAFAVNQCADFLTKNPIPNHEKSLIEQAILGQDSSFSGVSFSYTSFNEEGGLRLRDLLLMERSSGQEPLLSSESFMVAVENMVITNPDIMIDKIRLNYIVTVTYDVPLPDGRSQEILYVWYRRVEGKRVVYFLETDFNI